MTEPKPGTQYKVKIDRLKHIGENMVKFYRQSDDSLWTVAFFAAQVVGRYEKGATLELAAKLAKNEDTIGQWACAAQTYCELKADALALAPDMEQFRAISELRKRLTVSHFAKAGRLSRQHDLMWLDVFAMLQAAAESGISVEKMAELVDGENGDGKPTTWTGQVKRTYAGLLNISTNGSAPDGLAKVAAYCARKLKVEAEKYSDAEL